MNFLRHLIDLLFAAPEPANERPRTVTAQPSQAAAEEREPPRSGHVGRRRVAFRPLGENGIFPENEEHHYRRGNVLESNVLKVKAISASGRLVETEDLKSICSVCRRAEDIVIRSHVSRALLCRTCLRRFKCPDGRGIIVTPREYVRLKREFNTWKAFDAKRRRR